jgi:hypothetical protein
MLRYLAKVSDNKAIRQVNLVTGFDIVASFSSLIDCMK